MGGQPRWEHACGVYQDTNGQQVLLVTGGDDLTGRLSSTEVAIYTVGSQQLDWRETGQLDYARHGPRAAVVDNILYVTGGKNYDDDGQANIFNSILSWNPSTETWQQAGQLAEKKYLHAAVAIPSSILPSE